MKKVELTPEQKIYRKKIRRRKAILVLAFFIALAGMTWIAYDFFAARMNHEISPQLERTVRQITELLPQLQKNEETLRDTYEHMEESRKEFLESENLSESSLKPGEEEEELEDLIRDTLSWMNRVTKLRVGRNGLVYVFSKEDGTILAHPDESYVGKKVRIWGKPEAVLDLTEEGWDLNDLQIDGYEAISSLNPGSLDAKDTIRETFFGDRIVFGVEIAYKDTIIFCGSPFSDLLLSLISYILLTVLFFGLLLGLFVRWIMLVYDQHQTAARVFRSKLFATSMLLCITMFFASWYTQVLMDVADDLKTIDKHADVAVETLNTYGEQRDKINQWLDSQYLTQCRLAAGMVKRVGKENITREKLKEWSEKLEVKYIYIFDKYGKTIVTNSVYDHFTLSHDEKDQSYVFLPLLEGREYVIQEPMEDDSAGEKLQYIGVSLRNEEDLSDGFVQIAVDAGLRERLLKPLSVNTVLSNLVIGLPEHAIAVNKETLKIVDTTGIGHVDQSIEELGIEEDHLKGNYNGFLEINEKVYYAGVSESEDLYLVPVVVRKDGTGALLGALIFAAYYLLCSFAVSILSLLRYERDVLQDVPEEPEEIPEPEKEEKSENADDDDWGIANNLKNLFRTKEKWMFKERWRNSSDSKTDQKPSTRMKGIVYNLLLVFCLFVLVPSVYTKAGGADREFLSAFSYVISGNWEKGLNIFAFTSCMFLLCGMYVFVILINWILYTIARVSDTRVETVCLLLKSSLKYICAIAFIYYGLAQFGIDARALLASAGIAGLIISLGAKDLVSDVIAGFFIIFEGTIAVGDYVTIGHFGGTVMSIGIRTTRIVRFSEVRIMYNSTIRELSNWRGETGRAKITVPISYDTDLKTVEDILNEELPKLFGSVRNLQEPPAYKGVDELNERGVMLRITAYCDGYATYSVARSLSREVKLIFDRHNIRIPYPVLSVELPEKSEGSKDPSHQEK